MRCKWSKNARFGRNTGCSMIKIVVMFVLLMVAMSMIGNFVTKFLRGPPPAAELPRAKCGHCGRQVVGTSPCICGKG